MVFSDPTTKQGIVEDIDFHVNTDVFSYPIEEKTRNINSWYARAVSLILESDGRWQWDDSNWSDYPIGRANLVSGTQDYNMFVQPPDSGEDYLRLTRVRIKNREGNYIDINPIDQSDMRGTSKPSATETGTPQFYDKLGPSLFLSPIPDYNSTDGIQVFFQRAPSYFLTTDQAKIPGFASIFHRYLSYGAAYDYAVTKTLPGTKIQQLQTQIQILEQQIKSFHSKRGKDEQVRLVNGQNRTHCGVSRFR